MYKAFSAGLLGSNTYVVWDKESLECMIVDCGNPIFEPQKFIKNEGLKVKYIVLTHSHYDHAHFVSDYCDAFPEARLCAHSEEIKLLSDAEANVSMYFGTPERYPTPDTELFGGDVLSVGKSDFKVISTPGHTPGSICLYSRDEKLMLTGDTLFMCGRGRTDFKYGSEEDIRASLKKLFSMDGDILFLSGHGAPSHIGDEIGRVF